MNFQELYNKIKALDEGTGVMAPPSQPEMGECGDGKMVSPDDVLMGEKSMEECGMDMPGDIVHPPHAPAQSDSVSMNVSMNGSGPGGIRDLMDILRNIENATDGDDTEVVIGGPAGELELPFADESIEDGGFGSATTSPEQNIAGVDAITRTGNDMHSKGEEAEKVNGGGNPMGVSESLVARLAQHYQSIKESDSKIRRS